jgi:hypothetical protein
MADDPNVEPTIEPTEPDAPAPDVAPDSDPSIPDEQPVIEPDWLNEPVSQEPDQSLPQYQQPMPQYQQPQQPDAEAELNTFVRDPRAYMGEVARHEAAAIAQQAMAQHMAPINAQMNAYMEGQVAMQTAEADNSIRRMYKESFSKDEAFVGDKRVQQEVQKTLEGLRWQAEQQARMGNPRGLLMFQQPGFANVTLAAVKASLGATGGAVAPSAAPHAEPTAPTMKPEAVVDIDPDTAEALRSRFGDAYLERYKQSLADEQAGR